MSEWLLTKEEMAKAYFESENTSELSSVAIARAQLRKVAEWLQKNSLTRFDPMYSPRTYWDRPEWDSFMQEAGLRLGPRASLGKAEGER